MYVLYSLLRQIANSMIPYDFSWRSYVILSSPSFVLISLPHYPLEFPLPISQVRSHDPAIPLSIAPIPTLFIFRSTSFL